MTTSELWTAPTSSGPVTARVTVPGSKSATNRALVLAALADGPSVLRRPLDAEHNLGGLTSSLQLGGVRCLRGNGPVLTCPGWPWPRQP